MEHKKWGHLSRRRHDASTAGSRLVHGRGTDTYQIQFIMSLGRHRFTLSECVAVFSVSDPPGLGATRHRLVETKGNSCCTSSSLQVRPLRAYVVLQLEQGGGYVGDPTVTRKMAPGAHEMMLQWLAAACQG